jgi:hypothetical protein
MLAYHRIPALPTDRAYRRFYMRVHAISLVVAFLIITIPACGGSGVNPTAPTYPTGKPTGITATAGSRSVQLNWNPVNGAAGYYVYISTDGVVFNKIQGELIMTPSFMAIDLTNNKTYYFGVSAVGTGGWETSIAYPGGAPKAKAVIPQVPGVQPNPLEGVPPDPPTNLQGIAKDSACEINWSFSPEADFHYYRIYRSESGGIFILIRDEYFSTNFRNTDLTNGKTYSYRITAVDNEDLESDPSNMVTLTPENFPPEQLQDVAIFVNSGRIVLEWSIPTETDIAKYAIERVEGIEPTTGAEIVGRIVIDKPTGTAAVPNVYAGGFIEAYIDLVTNTIVVRDMGIIAGTTYTYRLSAIDLTKQEGPPVQITAPIPAF